ncbi:hypothetical protein ACOME3_001740 [Neoechinorhynchus agilis]
MYTHPDSCSESINSTGPHLLDTIDRCLHLAYTHAKKSIVRNVDKKGYESKLVEIIDEYKQLSVNSKFASEMISSELKMRSIEHPGSFVIERNNSPVLSGMTLEPVQSRFQKKVDSKENINECAFEELDEWLSDFELSSNCLSSLCDQISLSSNDGTICD